MITKVFTFDRSGLVERLDKLARNARGAFALACTTRFRAVWSLYATKGTVVGADLFDRQIDSLWDNLVMGLDLVGWGSEAALDGLTPPEPDVWDPYPIYAQEALSALIYTLQCFQSGNASYAAWAGMVSFDACEQAAVRQLKVQRGVEDHEARILAHPLVQRELERQERDIRQLECGSGIDSLRALRAQSELESVLGVEDILA